MEDNTRCYKTISIGCGGNSGFREQSILNKGFYTVGNWDNTWEGNIDEKNKDALENKNNIDSLFVLYIGKNKKCKLENQGKHIGIYRQTGYFEVTTGKEFRLLFTNNSGDYTIDNFDELCSKLDNCKGKEWGVYLEMIYSGELNFTNKASIRNFTRIADPVNVM